MSPMGWIITLFLALFLIMAPFLMIESFASGFPEPIKTTIIILFGYLGMPVLMCFFYKRKMFRQGQGAALFWVYCSVYGLVAFAGVEKIYNGDLSFNSIMTLLVPGAVAFFMIRFALKTQKEFGDAVEEIDRVDAERQREEDIQRQAEAILRAEEIKKQKEAQTP